MHDAKIAGFGVLVFSFLAAACSADSNSASSEGSLATNESQLVEDDADASATDEDLEAGLDGPLSGASEADPGSPGEAATDDEAFEKMRKNAGLFFKPAGCVTSTRSGNKVTHVFKDCTGPFGLVNFNGTVTATYVRAAGKLTVTIEATSFQANGATITGTRVLVFEKSGALIKKTRTGNWTGTTESGKSVTHQANFVTTWDPAAKCVTRDGSAETTVENRSFQRSVAGFKRCGVGSHGCPESGTITLTRTKNSESLSVVITFEGGTKALVTRPNGKKIERTLKCAAAS